MEPGREQQKKPERNNETRELKYWKVTLKPCYSNQRDAEKLRERAERGN